MRPRTRPYPRWPSEDQPSRGRAEHAVANQRRPTYRSRMQLPETMAIRLQSRANVTPIPATKMLRRARAPHAPYQAVAIGTSATATTISVAESNQLSGPASLSGRPKSRNVSLDPLRSPSLATPARRNTAAKRSRTTNRASSTMIEGTCRPKNSVYVVTTVGQAADVY